MTEALAPYPSPEERERQLTELARRVRGERVEYGVSREGRPLVGVRVPGTGSGPRETVLCSANIHGLEWIGGRVALGLLAALADPVGRVAELRSRAEVWILPCLNPDGYARTFERAGVGAVRELRTNAAGVDLNRNFPIPDGHKPSLLPVAGSSKKGSTFYRGEGPLSEPETRALDGLCREQGFSASMNLHSFMGTMITPRVLDGGHHDTYRGLFDAFASGQQHTRYWWLRSRTFDTFTGEQEDHQHHAHKTWAVCVEVFSLGASVRQHLRAPSTFWRFNPRQYEPWVENDVPGIVEYFLAALSLPPP